MKWWKKESVENQYKSSNIQIMGLPEITDKMEYIINGIIEENFQHWETSLKDSEGLLLSRIMDENSCIQRHIAEISEH